MKTLALVLTLALVPLVAPAADAMPPIYVCVAGTNAPDCYGDHDACVQVSQQVPFCADKPDVVVQAPPRVCVQGVRDCESGDWACVGQVCMMQPCQLCKPLEANPACTAAGVDTWAAGVTWHDCTRVDGYVCTHPAWYGGLGLLRGFVCEEATPFSLP